MKHLVIVLASIFTLAIGWGQTEDDPVAWSNTVTQISDTEYDINITGRILDQWHVYSQHTASGGSLPIEFTYPKEGEDYERIGSTEESETVSEYSEVFEVTETFFKDKAIFTQRIKLLKPELDRIDVGIFYQVCKEVCLTEERTFAISLSGKALAFEEKSIDGQSVLLGAKLKLDLKNKTLLTQGTSDTSDDMTSLWMIFGLGFLGGLIALLTPCVFPMIPLTVSFFTKQSQGKSKGIANAIWYGFFIILIYFLLSLPFHLFDSIDSQILNTIATNVWLNLFFFLIFVFFAFSFFGYYELTLPSSWANKMDAASSKAGGVLGIFFMAITLAIVSFSCTGPILGGLLGSTALADGNVATNLSAGMLGFGAALALPFALFALFPAWLNSLPKSGGWMTTVKVVLGFLELILAFKFLSNADLVGHWGLLKRELFIAIWIALLLGLAAYIFGFIRFPHDDPKQKKTIPRMLTGLLSIGFAIYLLAGAFKVWDLKLYGFLPPDFYTIAAQENDCPLGIDCFKNFEEGLVYAKQEKKPILLDFTGWACVNCRKMEENVWSTPEVYKLISDKYVLISLYVDDRASLPKNEQFDFKYETGRIKKINTIGKKWGTFQTINFNAASQPYYVLLSPNLEVLNNAVQYTDKETYRLWLKQGLETYNKDMQNVVKN